MKWNKIKKYIAGIDNIITNIVIILLAVILGFTIYYKAVGKEMFIFGYRPAFALTGSMEPEIMTHSLIMTKKVTDTSQIRVDDVVSFFVTQNGERVNVTHRIRRIEDGFIITKGDNNEDEDLYPVPLEDVHSKVVGVWNGFADLYNFFIYIAHHKLYAFMSFLKFTGISALIMSFFAGMGFFILRCMNRAKSSR